MSKEERRFLVRCRVSSGFFDGEVLVMVTDSLAYVIRQSDDRALIELPGQPVVGGARTWVPASDVSAAT